MFRIRSFPRKTLRWWRLKESSIDFDPDFQRTSRVWKDRDKAFLIDSILNGFDIPKVYVADFTKHDIPKLNTKHKSYAIIDGKQRLSAIFAFFNDALPLPKKLFLASAPTTNLGGLRFSEVKRRHPHAAELVNKYVLDVKAVETDDRNKINDIFLRLNKAARALNGAEVRNAMMGKAVDAIRTVGKHTFFLRRIRFSTNRGQERNASAKLLLLEYEGGPAETKKKNLDNFVVAVGEQGSGRFNKTLRRVKGNLQVLNGVFQNHDSLLGAQGHIPLYYLFITRLGLRDRKHIRNFLDAFEKKRTRNRNRNRGSSAGDSNLDTYDLASRSTNDKSSLETRLRIIRAKFATWKRHGTV